MALWKQPLSFMRVLQYSKVVPKILICGQLVLFILNLVLAPSLSIIPD
jgi:hypothetical protein